MQLGLLIGIKRGLFRGVDAATRRADAEAAALRPRVLDAARLTCAACRYQARSAGNMDVHHVDDNHANNAFENLAAACHTCHPYQHIGELVRHEQGSKQTAGPLRAEDLGHRTLLASIPEVSASDLNLLQRAIGAALADPSEASIAQEMLQRLAARASWLEADVGTFKPADFAAALAKLDDAAYGHRGDAISDIRLLFNADTLQALGRELLADYPSLPPSTWAAMERGAAAQSRGNAGLGIQPSSQP